MHRWFCLDWSMLFIWATLWFLWVHSGCSRKPWWEKAAQTSVVGPEMSWSKLSLGSVVEAYFGLDENLQTTESKHWQLSSFSSVLCLNRSQTNDWFQLNRLCFYIILVVSLILFALAHVKMWLFQCILVILIFINPNSIFIFIFSSLRYQPQQGFLLSLVSLL